MEPEEYNIHTDFFEGPLDLLLHLVKKNKMDIKESARFAIGSSIVALSHKDTINPNMSVVTVNKVLEEMEIC